MERIKKKLHSAFKLSGFTIRREFCNLIVDRLVQEDIDLTDPVTFEAKIKNVCDSLEKQCLVDKSIEKENVERAIEACLHSGCDKHETVFGIINAFNYPKFRYEPERKIYLPAFKASKLLSNADSKTQLFVDRYNTILQRTKRNFKNKIVGNEQDKVTLQTVDYLLTISYKSLGTTLILGSLLQVAVGKYYLEDPTGLVELDLSHAKYHAGFFVENIFVLVNGQYEDRILRVSTMILPPGEEYKDSRRFFGNLNYFGGVSSTPLRESQRLKEFMHRNPHNMMLFFSDIWLDHPMTFEKLEILFEGMQGSPPVAFVFMGSFMSESHASDTMERLKKLFKLLGELISRYPSLISNSQFVFVPSMSDPSTPHIVPRLALPKFVTEDLSKLVPKSIFTTNPCRLQYCTREVVLFRADVFAKFMQATLHKPKKEELADAVTRTIVSQGHLSPMSLNALPVHWDFDYCLRLFPLPDLIVIGDKCEGYEGKYKGTQLINPGPFCDSGFQFKSYMPYSDTLDDCQL